MYFHFPLNKFLLLLFAALILAVAVLFTFDFKRYLYGSTPFFPSVGLFAQEISGDFGYVVRRVGKGILKIGERGLAALGIMNATASSPPTGPAKAIGVLTYHRVVDFPDNSNVPRELFADQMKKLYNAGWRTITMKEYQAFMAGKLEVPEKSFVITFDDGAKGSFYPVDPILKEYGFTAISYIIVTSSEKPKSTYYLSPEEIKRMLATGRWEIGSHSYDGHHSYPIDPVNTQGNFFADKLWNFEADRLETPAEVAERLYSDFKNSRTFLEERYGVTVDTFAFPFGETGFITAGNYPEGISVSHEQAEKVYNYGFLQAHGDDYRFNYQKYPAFLAKRIHVDHDWDGTRLLSIMEGGNPKSLPFTDNFAVNRGWISSWGTVDAGWGSLILQSNDETSGASTILDGSLLWDEYEYNITADWESGFPFLLADVENSKTYTACAFSQGKVRLQSARGGSTVVLGEVSDPSINYGNGVNFGIRVLGNTAACVWDGKVLLRVSNLPDRSGGIGIQTWNPDVGTARLTIHGISVLSL